VSSQFATQAAVNANLTDALAAQAEQAAAQAAAMSNVTETLAAVLGGLSSLQTQLLAPPVCTLPGGVGLLFTGTAWMCNCAAGWSGSSCDVPPSPPPPSPPPSYTSCTGLPDGPVVLSAGGSLFNGTCVDGYVLLAKLSGISTAWHYGSSLWTSYNTLNPTSLAFDRTEAKLSSFNSFPIQSLRLGMVGIPGYETASIQTVNWISLSLDQTYSSMTRLMNDGTRITNLGRAAWNTLIPGFGAGEPNCNAEGINLNDPWSPGIRGQVRLGLFGNNENDCGSDDMAMGFGVTIEGYSYAVGMVCANICDGAQMFGYILGA
jgi:hypothetical protein